MKFTIILNKAKSRLFLTAITYFILMGMLKAEIITVDNKELSGADYTSLQDAIDAATAGDTIYVSGSPTSYGSITINKKLALFGQGYHPNNQYGNKTQLSSVTFDFVAFPSADPSESHFEGFEASSIHIDDGDGALHDITIRRSLITNRIDLGRGANNIIIENNIFYGNDWGAIRGSGTGANLVKNVIIRNNIFQSDYGGSVHATIYAFQSGSIIVTNNLFLSEASRPIPVGSVNTIVSNNIFYGAGVGTESSNCNFCTFTNNLSFGPGDTDFDYATNSTGNNLEATDPLFMDAEDFTFDFEDDYRLQGSSPAIGAGSDGTDIGITGGAAPWPISETEAPYIHSSFPHLPQVTEMNILNASVPVDGTLNVHFKAKIIE